MAINRKTRPDFLIPDKLELISPQRIELANGIPVYQIKTGTEAITRIDLIYQAGTRYQDTLFVAGATNSLLTEGTSTLSGAQIAEKIDSFGSYVFPNYDRDNAGIQLYSLDKHLESTMSIVWDMIHNSVFPDKEIEIYKNKKIQSLLVDKQRVEHIAKLEFNKKLFGQNHPYGVSGDIEDVNNFVRDHLTTFHERYKNNKLIIIITGPDCDRFTSVLNKALPYLKTESATNSGSDKFPAPLEDSNTISYQQVENSTQAAIRIGRIVPDRSHPDYHLLMVLNTLFGGYFGSRLMQNIREDKAYTYGIGSGIISLQENTYLSIASNVGQDVYEPAIDEVFSEMNRLRNELVPEPELSRVKNYIIGDIQRQLDGPFGLADVFRSLIIHDLDTSFINNLLNTVRKCTSNDLINIAQQYFEPDKFTISVAGPKKQ